ncbi:tetratricopeptide repeat protein [Rhizobium sp. BT03]|uniref:tetratricopeptide repeat protein n=1 Tax=Rhizobium sp. BT03 TaxID=3045156 RepID=UPI0024B3D7D9|nr:tetratricopeptide repeat protein [Rhizobium sp. BT03]WHO72116.1 tetratricopeptide repeat protein [Rhizobium sp. BT03]
MSIIGKGIGAVVLAIAGSALAVDPTGTTSGVATKALGIAAGLAGDIAGNEAHAAYTAFGDRYAAALFRRHPEIDRNHHIIMALRLSHLDATETILARFDEAGRNDFNDMRQVEAERVSALLWSYLKEARKFNSDGAASAEEKNILSILPTAYETALAARSGAAPDAATVRKELEDNVLRELSVEIGDTLPALLMAAFHGGTNGNDGWHDLFVRAASGRLKDNEAFKAIWNAEQLARIGAILDSVDKKIGRVLDGQTTAEREAERRHNEQMEMQARILDFVSEEKGIPVKELEPVLARLIGHSDVPRDKIARVLADAVDDLLARSRTLAIIHNDHPEIDRAINAARKKLETLDIEGALATVREAQRKQALQRRDQDKEDARLFLEEADILMPLYDHGGVVAALQQALMLDPDLIWRWDQLGDELRKTGQRLNAVAAFEAALEAAFKVGDERAIGVLYERIGDMCRAEGDAKGALQAYRNGLNIAKALAERDPSNAEWQRDLSICYDNIGNIRRAEGDAKGALQAYRNALDIAKALAERDPGNAQWQRDLSVSYDKIGDIRRTEADAKGALQAYQDSLNIRKTLAERDPGNAQWQRDLSFSYNKIGNIRQADGNAQGALQAYQDSLDIRKTLAEHDPGNAEWQRDLSISYDNIGGMRRAEGDAKGTLQAYQDSIDIAKALAERDPGNAEWQHDLSISYDRIGDMRRAEGDAKGALQAYQDSIDIRKTLIERDPDNVEWQRGMITSLVKLAECEPENASTHYAMALKIALTLSISGKLAPTEAWIPDDLAQRLEATHTSS